MEILQGIHLLVTKGKLHTLNTYHTEHKRISGFIRLRCNGRTTGTLDNYDLRAQLSSHRDGMPKTNNVFYNPNWYRILTNPDLQNQTPKKTCKTRKLLFHTNDDWYDIGHWNTMTQPNASSVVDKFEISETPDGWHRIDNELDFGSDGFIGSMPRFWNQ